MSAVASNLPVPAPAVADTLTVTVDGRAVAVPRLTPDWQGRAAPTTMLQACEAAGVTVPHYCYHARLPVAGNCRMCLVEFGTPALGPDRKPVVDASGAPKINKSPRPAIACATPITAGMEIYTTTSGVKQMREAVLEFLLINHPLDCPICDQAGECKLQEYSIEYGQARTRFVEAKVHKPKQVDLGPRIMLDDERCILCTRCIRFTRDVAGDDALGIVHRGSFNTLAAYPGRAFDHNYTLNTVDLCPVGALTSKDFRFQMRVWFLKESPGLCTSCATGCNILIGSRENRILRYTPRENAAVNESWMCDAGRLNYRWIGRADRLAVLRAGRRDSAGAPAAQGPSAPAGRDPEFEQAGGKADGGAWTATMETIAARLRAAPVGSVALIASARLSNEELFLIRLLAAKLGAITDTVPRQGVGDDWLVHADKNPNGLGARLLGVSAEPMGSALPRMAEGVRAGRVRTLLVFGEDVTRHGLGPESLDRLETLVVSDILPNATTARAEFLLPGCAPAEKRGSFTNAAGRVQRFIKAVEPPGEARPEFEFLAVLVGLVTGEAIPDHPPAVFDRLACEVEAFRGLTWAGLGDTGRPLPGTP